MNNKLFIYSLFQTEGKIDAYIMFFLENIKKYYNRIVVVCEEDLPSSEVRKLTNIKAEYHKPEKSFGLLPKYKNGLEFIGWDNLKNFDQIAFADSSLFGPIFDLKTFFARQEESGSDIWGCIKSSKRESFFYPRNTQDYLDEYIFPSFMIFNTKVIHSKAFIRYFKKIKAYTSSCDEFVFAITRMTKFFSDKDFSYDTFVNDEDFLATNYDCSVYACLDMAIKYRCPFVNKKAFVENYNGFLASVAGYQSAELFNFIKDKTTYNVDLILDNILRTEHQAVIRNNLHFNYILPSKQTCVNFDKIKTDKIALFMHLYYEDLLEYCLGYAKNMPENTDVFLTVISKEMESKAQKVFSELKCRSLKIILIKNQGRDVSALLIGGGKTLTQYDYVCFMHDKKTLQLKPLTVGQDFSYHCFEGNMASKEYILNILKTFHDNPRLGLLTPPPPEFANFYTISGFEWAGDYKIAKEIARKLNFHVKLDAEPIAPFGTMFWFRGKALKILLDYNWSYDDFPKEPTGVSDGTSMHALERLYPLAAQNAGYYPAWVSPDYFAARYMDNNYYMLRQLKINLFGKYGSLDFNNMLHYMYQSENKLRISSKYVRKIIKGYLKQKINKLFSRIKLQ